MRLFAAIEPPADEIVALSAALGTPDDRLRYVPTVQWHLTTAFYGDVDDAIVPDLTARLERAARRCAPLSLVLSDAGTFPKQSARAKVLWVGVTGDVDGLSRLAERCVAAGRRCGLSMEDRPYRPHVTIARTRRDPIDLRPTVESLSTYAGNPWTATSLRLVRSTLGANVTHETLTEFSFGP